MKEPNKKYGYYLGDLSDEQIEVCKELFDNENVANGRLIYTRYSVKRNKWLVDEREVEGFEYKNALELFQEDTLQELQERKTQLENELKKIESKLIELEPKEGDLCVFWDEGDKHKVIKFFSRKQESSKIRICITHENAYYENCEKITDQDFITKYKEYVKIN